MREVFICRKILYFCMKFFEKKPRKNSEFLKIGLSRGSLYCSGPGRGYGQRVGALRALWRWERSSRFCRRERAFRYLIFLGVGVWLFCWGLGRGEPRASTIGYGYQFLPTEEGRNFISISDGYCIFAHSGPFNRYCFELWTSFQFSPFKFNLGAQAVMYYLWLRPHIYGIVVTAGPLFVLHPSFYMGFRANLGFSFYFITPNVEFQMVSNFRGKTIYRTLIQVTVTIPTGSVNFMLGNVGL